MTRETKKWSGGSIGALIGAIAVPMLFMAFPDGQSLSDLILHRSASSAIDPCAIVLAALFSIFLVSGFVYETMPWKPLTHFVGCDL